MEGRRLFVEGLTVSGDRAAVTLRASTALDIRVRAFGGSQGRSLRFWGSASLNEGERVDYDLPLHGPAPSFTVSWEDTLGQAGAVTVEPEEIPYPLPSVEGELCDLRLVSLGWSPGAVEGVVASECEASVEEAVELQTVSGHESVTETTLLDAGVTEIAGTLSAATGASTASVEFVPNGETRFRLPVGAGEAIHGVTIDVHLEASLSIPMPPLTVLTHHPERTEERTETVSLYRPEASDSDSDSETITVTHDDGTTTEHTVSAYAYAYVPGRTVNKDVTLTIVHPEHVKAEVVERSPVTKARDETLAMASGVGADDPFAALALPEPEPVDPPRRADARRRRAGPLVRPAGLGVALVKRAATLLLLTGAALVFMGAAPAEERAMLEAFDKALTAMAYAASGLCVFAIVWAGFVLMAEGADERGGGRAKSAVALAVVGLVLVLSAKGVAALLRSGVVPFPFP